VSEPATGGIDDEGRWYVTPKDGKGGKVYPIDSPERARELGAKGQEARRARKQKDIEDVGMTVERRRNVANLLTEAGIANAKEVLSMADDKTVGVLARAVAVMSFSQIINGEVEVKTAGEAIKVASTALAVARLEEGKSGLRTEEEQEQFAREVMAKLREKRAG
jgi:hypothetical protein